MTSSADVRIAIPGRIMTALHTEPVMMRPLMVHVRALLVYHLPGCTASQRQVRDPHRQHLISNNSIQCGNFFICMRTNRCSNNWLSFTHSNERNVIW